MTKFLCFFCAIECFEHKMIFTGLMLIYIIVAKEFVS